MPEAKPDITVIIPSYNRPNLLRRALGYWSGFPVQVIIVDGSLSAYTGEIPENACYLNDPYSSIGARWHHGISLVETEYAVLCGDDDFLTFTGLRECVAFLRDDHDFVSAQGYVLDFQLDNKGKIVTHPLNVKAMSLTIADELPQYRLRSLFRDYIEHTYAVFRSEVIKRAIRTCVDQTNPHYIEISIGLTSCVYGKHKVIPVLYQIRQLIEGSARGSFELPRFESFDFTKRPLFELWKSNLTSLFKDTLPTSVDKAEELFDEIYSQYLIFTEMVDPHALPLSTKLHQRPLLDILKIILRSFTSPSLLWWRRRRRLKHRNNRILDFLLANPRAREDFAKVQDAIKLYYSQLNA